MRTTHLGGLLPSPQGQIHAINTSATAGLGCASSWICSPVPAARAKTGTASCAPALSTSSLPVQTRLEEAGVQVTFSYYGDLLGNSAGGVRQGLGCDGRLGTIIDADLEKLLGWSGATFHASIHQIHGTSFSLNNLDNIMLASSVEAPPSTRLFNLWTEQKLGPDTNGRVGQYSAAQEFLVSQNAALFVNSTFGWPALPAENLPSVGPAHPEATPGARIAYTPDDHLTPAQTDPYGLAFRVSDPPLLIGEIDYQQRKGAASNPAQEGTRIPTPQLSSASEASGLPGTVKLGAWVLTGVYHDQMPVSSGGGRTETMPSMASSIKRSGARRPEAIAA